jgi:putative (di)nucleoside polyphosphate hydrolase
MVHNKISWQNSEINLNTKHPEFIEWKWLEPKKLPEVIVDFKKNLYLKLLNEINSVID